LYKKSFVPKTNAHSPIPSGGDRLLLLLLKSILPGENASAERAVRIEAHPIVPKQQKNKAEIQNLSTAVCNGAEILVLNFFYQFRTGLSLET
jgi:hypothetical protein